MELTAINPVKLNGKNRDSRKTFIGRLVTANRVLAKIGKRLFDCHIKLNNHTVSIRGCHVSKSLFVSQEFRINQCKNIKRMSLTCNANFT
jgi:hypothetical protein